MACRQKIALLVALGVVRYLDLIREFVLAQFDTSHLITLPEHRGSNGSH